MKKFIIFIVCLILIFCVSFYIGSKIDLPEETSKVEEKIETTAKQAQNETTETEETVSEDEPNSEHYVLREVNKYINVYIIDNNENEELYLSTDICTEYLPETDKASLKEGINVYNQEELNEVLQDFE